jgi:hypothetical protein
MNIKIKLSAQRNKQSEVEITVREVRMDQQVEAHGRKSICALVDLRDWDAARRRLHELGVKLRHHNNKPVVNIEEVKQSSKRWFKKRSTPINTP